MATAANVQNSSAATKMGAVVFLMFPSLCKVRAFHYHFLHSSQYASIDPCMCINLYMRVHFSKNKDIPSAKWYDEVMRSKGGTEGLHNPEVVHADLRL